MTITTIDDDPGGFRILSGKFWNDENSGEAHVQAPDGSICHLKWDTPDDVHFEEVPMTERAEDLPPVGEDEAEYLRSLFPDVVESYDRHRALDKDPIYFNLPDLERQWEDWKTARG